MLVGLVASTACRSSRRWTGRRVLYYGQDLARPMPRAHILWSKVTLVAPSPIGNAYLGSGRLPRPARARTPVDRTSFLRSSSAAAKTARRDEEPRPVAFLNATRTAN